MFGDQTCGQTPAQDQNCLSLCALEFEDGLDGFTGLHILMHPDVAGCRAQVQVGDLVENLRVLIFQSLRQG